jgi:hypothetical protein
MLSRSFAAVKRGVFYKPLARGTWRRRDGRP